MPTLVLAPLGLPKGRPRLGLISTAGELVLSSLGAGDGSPGCVIDLCALPDLDAVNAWAGIDTVGNSYSTSSGRASASVPVAFAITAPRFAKFDRSAHCLPTEFSCATWLPTRGPGWPMGVATSVCRAVPSPFVLLPVPFIHSFLFRPVAASRAALVSATGTSSVRRRLGEGPPDKVTIVGRSRKGR